jgi:hypothetical protein
VTVQVFVDETKRRGFAMAAIAVKADHVGEYRRRIRSHLRRGQRRIHFTNESPKQRRIVLTEIKSWTITANIYTHPAKDIREARGHRLTAIASEAASGSASRLVIEREEAHDEHDRHLLTELMRTKERSVRWDLLPPTAEPLLWAADAVAWCWGNPQTKWSSLVKPFIQNVHRL